MEGSEEEETFVEENSEWIDVHHLDQSSFENSDVLDDTFDSKAHSLRSSRRRVQKHSAVVLTSQRMKKFTSHSNDSNTTNDLIQIVEESEEEIEVFEKDHQEETSFTKHSHHNPVQHSPSKAATLATSLLNKISPNSKKSPSDQTSPPAPANEDNDHHHPSSLRNHMMLVKNNDRKKQKNKITETQAAFMILAWWNEKKQLRLLKFTQNGQWSYQTSIKLLSLILGYRLRKIFKSYEIQRLINSQKDCKRVLSELLEQYIHEPKVNSPKTKFPVSNVKQTIDYWLFYLQKLQSTQSILPGADQVLAKSLIKQLLAEREKFIKVLYQDCQWISFPKPGYRLLNREKFLKKAPASLGGVHRATTAAASPLRPVRSASLEKKMQDTPPHVKAAIQPSALHEKAMKKSIKINQPPTNTPNFKLDVLEESLFEDSDQSNHHRPVKTAKPLKALVDESRLGRKGSPNTSTSVKARSSADESRGSSSVINSKSHDSSFHSNRSLSTLAGHGQKNTPATSSSISIPRKRNNDGGHIQLEVISGERLIPAKKGAAKEGNPVADRKPCLKVMFFLPSNSGPGTAPTTLPKSPGNVGDVNNGLRKVFQQAKDYTAVTLNPKWNASFVVNLPFSKSTLRTAIERHQLQHTFNNAAGLSDAEYEIICKAMLQYWSGGILEVEVYDGERFNEDIFMGKVQLLVTSFLPLIKKFNDLEMKGSYTLEKAKPKDRVSGSISIIAYFHVPEKKYIEEQIIQLLTSIKYQEMEAAANNQQQERRGNSRNGRNSILTSEDSSNDDGGNESSSSDVYNQSKQHRRLTQLHFQDGNQGKKVLSARKSLIPKSSNDDYPAVPSPLTIGGSRNPPQPPSSSSNTNKTPNPTQLKKIPIPGHSLAAASSHSNNSSNSSISNFMKTLAGERIKSQDNLAILLNDPTLEESYNVRIPNNPPAGTPNYLRTPSSVFTPQTEGSGSSASSSIRRPFSARSMPMDPNSTPPPISSLDEIRGSNIHVSSIVSKEAAIESKLTKRHFLQDMAKQLTGLEQLVNKNSDQVMVESISNKVLSKKISQVIDVHAANNIAAAHVSPEQKSPVRLPSGYHPRSSFSPGNVAPAVSNVNKAVDQHPGRASISKGLSSLKSHVNQTVQNLERFLDDIPLIDPEEEDNHDSEEEIIRGHQRPFAENHPNKNKKSQMQAHNRPLHTTTHEQQKQLSPVKTSPVKPVFRSTHYDDDEDGASYEDGELMYEEDEDNQFRKHPSREILSPTRKTTISLDSDNIDELKLLAKRDDNDSDKDEEDDSDRNDFEFEEEELVNSDQEYREKRISVRDYPNQHEFKYHDPTSSSPLKSSPGRFPLSVSTAGIAQTHEEHHHLRTPPSKPPSSSHSVPNSSHKMKSPSKEEREEDRRILSSVSYQSSSLDHSVNVTSSPPAIPSRSSSKPVYESKSLSQSDIDELSQRVKLLSRLSYSSTDGENSQFAAASHQSGIMTSTLSFSKSTDEYVDISSPSKASVNSPMKPLSAPNSQTRSRVNNEDRGLTNENVSSSPLKKVVQQKEPAVNKTKAAEQVKGGQNPSGPVSPVRVTNSKPATTPSSIPKLLRSGVKSTLTSIKQSLSHSEVSTSSSPSTKRTSVSRPVPQTNTTVSRLAAGRDARSRPGSAKIVKTSLHLEEANL